MQEISKWWALFLPSAVNKIMVADKDTYHHTCAVFLCLFLISFLHSFEGISSSLGKEKSGALLLACCSVELTSSGDDLLSGD